jgi:hypothetical protein
VRKGENESTEMREKWNKGICMESRSSYRTCSDVVGRRSQFRRRQKRPLRLRHHPKYVELDLHDESGACYMIFLRGAMEELWWSTSWYGVVLLAASDLQSAMWPAEGTSRSRVVSLGNESEVKSLLCRRVAVLGRHVAVHDTGVLSTVVCWSAIWSRLDARALQISRLTP